MKPVLWCVRCTPGVSPPLGLCARHQRQQRWFLAAVVALCALCFYWGTTR